MRPDKHFLILGLDAFGAALAQRLTKNGCRVTGVDRSEMRVDELKDELYQAVVADASDDEALAELHPETADYVVISLGKNIEASLLTTLHAQELGAKRILAKAVTEDHGKLLQKLDVERIIMPETEIAVHVADRLTWPNVLDFLPLGSNYTVVEIAVPKSLEGRTLGEADLRRKHRVTVLAIKDARSDQPDVIPLAEHRFSPGQLLLVAGLTEDVNQFRDLA
jgi:trk system potassium uptake protein TrkA